MVLHLVMSRPPPIISQALAQLLIYTVELFIPLMRGVEICLCTALVVGSDDVASSYCIGVLMGRLAGRREGSQGARVVASY